MAETSYTLTDLGNVRKLAAEQRDKLRFVVELGRWYQWDGKRWGPTLNGKELLQACEALAWSYFRSEDEEKRRWGRICMSAGRIGALMGLAEHYLAISAQEFDSDPWLLNTPKGVFNLKTGQLLKHDSRLLCSRMTQVPAGDPKKTPLTNRFLARIFNGDRNLCAYVYRLLGYCLTGSIQEQKLFVWYGTGANGKSTLGDLVRYTLGDYAAVAAPGLLESPRGGERHPAELADLEGVRVAFVAEIDPHARLNEGRLKQLTGEEFLKARGMRENWRQVRNQAKLIYVVNHQPPLSAADHGIRRRMEQLPFVVQIPEEERDRDMLAKLKEEASGFLGLLISGGLKAYLEMGLKPSSAVQEATEEYVETFDLIGDWAAQCVLNEPGASLGRQEAYWSFVAWARRSGHYVGSQTWFTQRLMERRWETGKVEGLRFWRGRKLTPEAQEDAQHVGLIREVNGNGR